MALSLVVLIGSSSSPFQVVLNLPCFLLFQVVLIVSDILSFQVVFIVSGILLFQVVFIESCIILFQVAFIESCVLLLQVVLTAPCISPSQLVLTAPCISPSQVLLTASSCLSLFQGYPPAARSRPSALCGEGCGVTQKVRAHQAVTLYAAQRGNSATQGSHVTRLPQQLVHVNDQIMVITSRCLTQVQLVLKGGRRRVKGRLLLSVLVDKM